MPLKLAVIFAVLSLTGCPAPSGGLAIRPTPTTQSSVRVFSNPVSVTLVNNSVETEVLSFGSCRWHNFSPLNGNFLIASAGQTAIWPVQPSGVIETTHFPRCRKTGGWAKIDIGPVRLFFDCAIDIKYIGPDSYDFAMDPKLTGYGCAGSVVQTGPKAALFTYAVRK